MKLGTIVRITRAVSDPEKSLSFYQKLGFKEIKEDKSNPSTLLLTDGVVCYQLCQNNTPFTELTYFSDDADLKLSLLKNAGIALTKEPPTEGTFLSPNGLSIRLIKRDKAAVANMYKPDGNPIALCRKFYDVCLEMDDIDEGLEFWQKIGFDKIEYSQANQFVTVNDGLIRLSLYKRGSCPHEFSNPSITYFSQDSADRIAKLKTIGMIFRTEMDMGNKEGVINHVIAEDPEGQFFFIFQADEEF